MSAKPLVFVSSTSTLAEERSRLQRELPPAVYELYLFEQDVARGASPEAHCARRIAECDVFVGVLGSDYGSLHPDGAQSIVEWEHGLAAKRDNLEKLDFVKGVPPAGPRDPRQQAFIDRVSDFRDGRWVKTFRTADELASIVHMSLEGWLAAFFSALQARRAAWHQVLSLPLTAVPAAAVVGLVALAWSGAAARLTANAMVGLCIAAEAIVLTCAITLWFTGGSHD